MWLHIHAGATGASNMDNTVDLLMFYKIIIVILGSDLMLNIEMERWAYWLFFIFSFVDSFHFQYWRLSQWQCSQWCSFIDSFHFQY